ncbi:NAD(P)H-dependent oxidoreductase [Agrobacterium rhizogenes]|nr:NAD(P)H-dependent oxidoreductase [Rhizobium rhizogenes]NTG19396.1 NAD(P)H-dependent oxidoreductase [Rhizobium rhizogenes]NTG26189.1 NAD(P)H-dependent oxidoreductase [Rhizobium rhizogenes]NTI86048.1 NAD(P)H-dependent oxidoreductase [Rhizobium rhizogenes]NTI99277.1 NAD(P)H-dependent oxidoreductase [Rhizobium rhizogenes]
MISHPNALKITILSCSLDPQSRSYVLAREAERILRARGHIPSFIDLRSVSLPNFDNADCYAHPTYLQMHDAIQSADGVMLSVPIYNWSIGSVAKSLIELTGATGDGGRTAAWFDQVVTFVCAGGLPHSYMAYAPTAMSLMLDFKCVINPYVVYATTRDWSGDKLSDALATRLSRTLDVKLELASLLKARRYKSEWEV